MQKKYGKPLPTYRLISCDSADFCSMLQGVVESADDRVRTEGAHVAGTDDLATTVAIAMFCQKADANDYAMIYAHVGDSRVYLLPEQGPLKRLTTDDGLLGRLVENQMVTEEDARHIDQAMLAQITAPVHRPALFARYKLVASLSTALGALVAGLPDLLGRAGLPLVSGIRLLFGVYALLGLVVAGLSLRLSPPVVAPVRPPIRGQSLRQRLAPRLTRSRDTVWRLTALFSVDALAGGLVVQSLMALFFHLRFGIPLTTLSALFFGANLLSALSFLAAVPLVRRFGLLNTMVFTHLPSNLLLILVPLMPTGALAAAVFLSRMSISQMDVPTRQSYTMAVVDPDERTAAAGLTNVARNAATALSPTVTGWALSVAALGLPFFIAGGIKVVYDVLVFLSFRHLRPPEEQASSKPPG